MVGQDGEFTLNAVFSVMEMLYKLPKLHLYYTLKAVGKEVFMIQNIAKLLWFFRLCIFTKRKSNACVTWLLSSNVILASRAKWFRKKTTCWYFMQNFRNIESDWILSHGTMSRQFLCTTSISHPFTLKIPVSHLLYITNNIENCF